MGNDFPQGFVPDEQPKFPAGFVPDEQGASAQGPPKPPPGIGLPDPAQQAHDTTVGSMGNAVKQQLATLDPQDRYVASLPEGKQRNEATERMGKGMSMALPETLMSVGAMGPVGAIQRQGVMGAAKTLGKAALRGAAGSYAGSRVGEPVGSQIGRWLGDEETGKKVGSAVGAVGGGIVGVKSPESIAKLPFGLGRMLSSDEDYANMLSARKLAQIKADIAAGVRESPAPLVSTGNGEFPADKLAAFMNKGYAPLALPEGASRAMPKPMRPLVGTPEEWAAYDRQIGILKPEASDAGLYHAARGAASKSTNLQERLGRAFRK